MKVTHFSRAGFPLALGGWSTGTISVNSNFNTTDGGFSALNFVQGITANGSNMLLRPIANIAAGSNILLTIDQGPGGSSPSNTIRIHSTASGGGNIITANGSNSLAAVVNLKAGTNIALGVSGQDITITNTGSGGGGGGGSATFHGAKATTTAATALSSGIEKLIPFEAEDYDTDAYHDNSTNNSRMTIPSGLAGKYLFVAQIVINVVSTDNQYAVFTLNGATNYRAYSGRMGASGAGPAGHNLSVILDLVVGDYVEVYALVGANVNLLTTANFNWFSAAFLGA